MESPERMPIACVHCAKAKAKCDKKVSRGSQTTIPQKKGRCGGQWHDCGAGGVTYLWQGSRFFGLPDASPSVGNKKLIDSTGAVLAMCKQADSLPIKSDSAIISGALTSRDQSSAAASGACFACLGRLPYLAIIIPAA